MASPDGFTSDADLAAIISQLGLDGDGNINAGQLQSAATASASDSIARALEVYQESERLRITLSASAADGKNGADGDTNNPDTIKKGTADPIEKEMTPAMAIFQASTGIDTDEEEEEEGNDDDDGEEEDSSATSDEADAKSVKHDDGEEGEGEDEPQLPSNLPVPDVVFELILLSLDEDTMKRCQAVNHFWRKHLRNSESLWKGFCEATFVLPAYKPVKLLVPSGKPRRFKSWVKTARRRPHLRMNGMYFQTHFYIRNPGPRSMWSVGYKTAHMVYHYRFMWFLPGGKVLYAVSPTAPTTTEAHMRRLIMDHSRAKLAHATCEAEEAGVGGGDENPDNDVDPSDSNRSIRFGANGSIVHGRVAKSGHESEDDEQDEDAFFHPSSLEAVANRHASEAASSKQSNNNKPKPRRRNHANNASSGNPADPALQLNGGGAGLSGNAKLKLQRIYVGDYRVREGGEVTVLVSMQRHSVKLVLEIRDSLYGENDKLTMLSLQTVYHATSNEVQTHRVPDDSPEFVYRSSIAVPRPEAKEDALARRLLSER